MNIQSALKSQYHAALKALRLAVEKCPDALWDDPADGAAPFWRVVYHTLFYTHFYLQQDQKSFIPWVGHREEADFLGAVPDDTAHPPKPCKPYTRGELLEYWRVCDGMIDAGVDALDLSAPRCGFPWYEMPTLEHQILNIRHIQNHAAALATRLRRSAGISIDWVGGDEMRRE
jgi:DinB superfamily